MASTKQSMDQDINKIPRIVWLLWYQGISDTPYFIKKCIDSWIRENPTWEVVVLDSNNLDNYVNLDLPDNVLERLSIAHKSDLVRLALLSQYGGIWADATTYCTKPLDQWIDKYSESGFFVFHKPGRDRIMANWFIASNKECPLVSKLYEQLRLYWVKNSFNRPNKIQRKTIAILSKILNRSDNTTKYWFHPIVTKLLKIYPYYVFHYMFERLVSTDSEASAVWKGTKRLSADIPHLIQEIGGFTEVTQSIIDKIHDVDIPMFKLTSWNYDHRRYTPGTLLYYLIEEKSDLINENPLKVE